MIYSVVQMNDTYISHNQLWFRVYLGSAHRTLCVTVTLIVITMYSIMYILAATTYVGIGRYTTIVLNLVYEHLLR